MLWIWITIALALLLALIGLLTTAKGTVVTLVFGVLLAIATSGASGAAAWFYGKNEGKLKKRRRSAAIFTFIVLAVPLSAVAYYMLQSPALITVSPPRVNLTQLADLPNKLRGNFNLTVHNRADVPQYNVWVRLVISSKILRTETLDIDFPTMEELSLSVKAMLDMAVGTMCLGGTDKYNNPAFLCVIDKLNPNEMFTIKFTSRYSIDTSSPERTGHLSAILVKSSDQPGQHFDNSKGQQTTSAVVHEPPEPFTKTRMIHFCPDLPESYKLPTGAECTPNSQHNFKGQ